MSNSPAFTIGQVSLETGLSTHVIRAWERRYSAVTPMRSASGRRQYCQAEIDRLVLLKHLVAQGYRISHIAELDQKNLANLVRRTNTTRSISRSMLQAPFDIDKATPLPNIINACMQAVEALDGAALEQLLQQASLDFNRQTILTGIVAPLMNNVGREWSKGALRIVHGHLAANAIQGCLIGMLQRHAIHSDQRPTLIVATPAGQWCYLGALAVAVIAQDHGWEPIYLGCNLPGEELAAAQLKIKSQMMALSITCRSSDTFIHEELQRLSSLLDGNTTMVVGGRASSYYRSSIESAGATLCASTEDLIRVLN